MEKLCLSAYSDIKVKIRMKTVFIVVCLLVLFSCDLCLAKANILIYTKNGKGYVHDNIDASVECLKNICKKNGWDCQVSDDASIFTKEKISKFDVLVFSNTNNETFDTQQQRDVFKAYIQGGGGFVGIHSVCGSERNWPWFWANLGGKFVRHPDFQKFDVKVIDHDNPSTAHLGEIWKWEDECYFMNQLNPDIHVLLAVDLVTIKDEGKKDYPGEVFGQYFPLCWCHEFDGGRQWYTALGHSIDHYKDENFKKHLEGGIKWVLKDIYTDPN
ncbi:MAG: ThuA domain-containing protein [Planctomycetes bacterium]|nr:ThuA domain-containing protein [Planctomycetota bacterium]